MEQAAQDSPYVTTNDIQRTLNKWYPRGLEMFGDERGGGTNVRFGLKPMRNKEAQDLYIEEVGKLVRDLNMRYIRARVPGLDLHEAERVLDEILAEREPVQGVTWEELIHLPDRAFFRRRGVPAFELTGWQGESFDDLKSYLEHLCKHLPDAYRASRDFRHYVEQAEKLDAGEVTLKEAVSAMPGLRRVGGVCPCSKSVRWVAGEAEAAAGETGSAA